MSHRWSSRRAGWCVGWCRTSAALAIAVVPDGGKPIHTHTHTHTCACAPHATCVIRNSTPWRLGKRAARAGTRRHVPSSRDSAQCGLPTGIALAQPVSYILLGCRGHGRPPLAAAPRTGPHPWSNTAAGASTASECFLPLPDRPASGLHTFPRLAVYQRWGWGLAGYGWLYYYGRARLCLGCIAHPEPPLHTSVSRVTPSSGCCTVKYRCPAALITSGRSHSSAK